METTYTYAGSEYPGVACEGMFFVSGMSCMAFQRAFGMDPLFLALVSVGFGLGLV